MFDLPAWHYVVMEFIHVSRRRRRVQERCQKASLWISFSSVLLLAEGYAFASRGRVSEPWVLARVLVCKTCVRGNRECVVVCAW